MGAVFMARADTCILWGDRTTRCYSQVSRALHIHHFYASLGCLILLCHYLCKSVEDFRKTENTYSYVVHS